MRTSSMHREQREKFLAALGERGAAAVIPTATAKLRNADSEYRFRPESDFWYLTGFGEPDSVLVLLPAGPGGNGGPRSVLFLREKKREEEVWTGWRLGVEAAPGELGIDAAHSIRELWTKLPELLRGYASVVTPLGLDEARDRAMLALLQRLRKEVRSAHALPYALLDPAPILHELRLFKSPAELELMRRAAAITAEAHVEARRVARPGARENEVEAAIESTFRRLGSSGPAYTPIVACGANACVLHYIENDAVLRAGDLLLIDAGAEFGFYAADVTRTFPVDGRFREEQRLLYELVLRAQLDALALVRAGASFQSVHDAAVRTLAEGLVELGLLRGTADDALASGSFKRFYMHRTSHWLGLDVHDCGAYVVGGESRALAPGMVLTIEPGLYVAPDDETVEQRWRGIGIRIEDDVLVTEVGHEVLTAAIPKDALELELVR